MLERTRVSVSTSDTEYAWGGSWSRIQKNPHGDACRTHGNRPGWTQDAGSRVAFGKNRAGQKPAWVDCQKKRSRERLIP
jgi:hypothetical protein